MRAVIGREAERDSRHHRGVVRELRGIGRRGGGRDRECEKERDDPAHHQSSRTARTASMESARRPASNAVAAAAAISATVTVASSAYGRRVSMVQWKDCGLTTRISTWLM